MTTESSKRSTRSSAPSSNAASTSEPAELQRHKAERYEIVEIDRRLIQGAEYNPRTITETARKKLKAAIAKVGLLGPVIWNKRTGRLVGGHQRLGALDAINRSTAYKLVVSQVDLSEDEERAANILLNNPEAQGEWDFEKLGKMLKSETLDLESAGMGASDIFRIIGEEAPDVVLDEIQSRIKDMDSVAEKTKQTEIDNGTDFYMVVVFRDKAERNAALAKLGFGDRPSVGGDDRYVSGDELMRRVQVIEE